MEKLSNYGAELDYELMKSYLANYSQVTLKVLGLLLDFAGLESAFVQKVVNTNFTSKMLTSSKEFSNKWRLYYDQVIAEQVFND